MPAATRSALLLVAALLLAACAAGASALDPSPGPDPLGTRSADSGTRTVVERRVGAGALVVTVTESAAGRTGRMEVVDEAGVRILIAEEVVVGDDHYVHLAAAEDALFDRAAWIRFDLSDDRHVAFLQAKPLGLVEQAAAFDAVAGDRFGSDVVDRVERLGSGRRVLHLATGLPVHLRRTPVDPAPVVEAPDSLPVVRFEDVEELVARPG